MQTKQTASAEQLRKITREKVDAIRGDRTLSDHGKRTKIHTAHAAAKNEMKALRDAEADELGQRRDYLTSRLFGPSAKRLQGADLIAYRDAADRVAKAKTPSDAESMLRQAIADGDDQLAVAVARRASDLVIEPRIGRAWHGVFVQWADTRRGTLHDMDDVLTELDAINEHNSLNTASVMRFSLPSPAEARMSLAEQRGTGATG